MTEIYFPTGEEKEKLCKASDKIIDILDKFEDKLKVYLLKSIISVMTLSEEELRRELNRGF